MVAIDKSLNNNQSPPRGDWAPPALQGISISMVCPLAKGSVPAGQTCGNPFCSHALLCLLWPMTKLQLCLDLSAAFDIENHHILLSVRSDMEISGKALPWFKSYLTGCSFKISLQGHTFLPHPLPTGIPKGLVLDVMENFEHVSGNC